MDESILMLLQYKETLSGLFKMLELTEVMQQRGDAKFIDLFDLFDMWVPEPDDNSLKYSSQML